MKKFKGTDENWEYNKPTDKFDASTSSESGKIIGYCAKNSEADRADEKDKQNKVNKILNDFRTKPKTLENGK